MHTTETAPAAATMDPFWGDAPAPTPPAPEPQKSYAPSLAFYHPNAKGTGCAVKFNLRPAENDREGCIFAALANQKSLAEGVRAEGSHRAATFAWTEKITVKLNFSDLCQLLWVLSGKADSLQEGKGLYHDSGGNVTVIRLSRQTDPLPGYCFEASKKQKGSEDAPARARIFFGEAEAAGLAQVLAAALRPVAFGL